eukprot:CAMPEP_0195299244 /NCGR_PEP_ID=MMETSP0707-20130614/25159_1 /TAXON_ID=33640 /ORGANISM="Asterionellopsis glacialis, Strain CCMP134" /LENGTH=301 /DNA_ID=CAMNT_0040361591 /DNA_START=93 /DNA_END=995 /DNA_ORIENTATION=+
MTRPQRPRQQKVKMLPLTIIIAIIASFLFQGVQIAASFDYQRLRCVDYNNATSSYLFRGNLPMNRHGMFDPTLVVNSIQTYRQEAQNLEYGKDYEATSSFSNKKLIVVSLLSKHASDEKSMLMKELSFRYTCSNIDDDFNTKEGRNNAQQQKQQLCSHENDDNNKNIHQRLQEVQVLHRPIVGSWMLPPPSWYIIPHFIKTLIWNWCQPSDGAWEMAEELKLLLQHNQNTIVYVHCMRGIDRTGLLSGTYMLRYLLQSSDSKNNNGDHPYLGATATDKVNSINYNIGHRPINWPAQNALEW